MAQLDIPGRNRNAICLVVDRLSAGFLGAYGNTWIATPNFDRLAAGSFLFDQALIDSPHVDQLYRAYWQGIPAASLSNGESQSNLASLLADVGIESLLLTDEAEVLDFPAARYFDSREQIELHLPMVAADSVAQTNLATFFATSLEMLAELERPSLLWLHTRGMASPWDAPLGFRQSYADEEDPPPPSDVAVPFRYLPTDYDPDELLGIMHCYAGQVALWDTCFGALIDALDASSQGDRTLLIVLGARGFPLGEHLVIGADHQTSPLYGELVHVPWLLRLPDGAGASLHSSCIVQPCDLFTTLGAWFTDSAAKDASCGGANLLDVVDGEESQMRNRGAIAGYSSEWVVRTAAWYLRHGSDGQDQLFRKPDDRWEVNDVADLFPEIIEGLTAAYREAQHGIWHSPLDELLVTGVT